MHCRTDGRKRSIADQGKRIIASGLLRKAPGCREATTLPAIRPGRLWTRLFLVGLLFALPTCGDGSTSSTLPDEAMLTAPPCDPSHVTWMQPFGNVDHGGGNAFFHNGVDFGTVNRGRFLSSADGKVTEVDLNTGMGWPGTNYRIVIRVSGTLSLDYHFEIGGEVPEAQRKNSIFVSTGDTVRTGQPIADLIAVSGAAHVHWGVYDRSRTDNCPLDYFSDEGARRFEELYDSGIEKRPGYRRDICE